MPKPLPKPLPFGIAAEATTSLTDQVAAGLRTGIARGYYRPGDRLPTLAQTSQALGVSLIVVRRAIARLAAAGLVVPQHGRGIVVAERVPGRWRAHLAHVHWSSTRSYFQAVFAVALHEYLQSRAVLPLSLLASPHEQSEGFAATRTLLETQPISVLLLDGLGDGLVPLLLESGLPFVHLTHREPHPAASCGISFDQEGPLHQVAQLAAASGARRVLQLTGGDQPTALADLLQERGIHYRLLQVDPRRCHLPDQLARLAYERLSHDLAHQAERPDLLFCDDDVVALGGLLAVQQAGLRVPAEFQLITRANRGNVPLFPVPLTRFELDPAEVARQVGEAVLAVVDQPAAPRAPITLRPCFRAGETLRLSPTAQVRCAAGHRLPLPIASAHTE